MDKQQEETYKIKKGFHIVLICAFCNRVRLYTADTKAEIIKKIEDEKWEIRPTYYAGNEPTGRFADICIGCKQKRAL